MPSVNQPETSGFSGFALVAKDQQGSSRRGARKTSLLERGPNECTVEAILCLVRVVLGAEQHTLYAGVSG